MRIVLIVKGDFYVILGWSCLGAVIKGEKMEGLQDKELGNFSDFFVSIETIPYTVF